MDFIKGIMSTIVFLTILPLKTEHNDLKMAAKYMPLFPIIGLGIGALSGSFGYLFLNVFPSIIAGVLTLGVLLVITGLHHTDGLLDFGDGLMVKGTKKQKILAMRDKITGTGGFAFGFVVLITTAFSISFLAGTVILALIVSETTAKASMVLAASFGRSAYRGTSTIFTRTMQSKHWTTRSVPIIFALAIGFWSLGYVGLLTVSLGLLVCPVIVAMSYRSFGGLTGDVFGALNDLTRVTTLLAFVVLI